MVVREIMTVNPVTVSTEDSLDTVARLLQELDVRHVPVLEDGALKGIISDRDLSPYRMETGRFPTTVSAGQVMSSNLFTVDPEADLGEVVDTLLDQKVGALPVVDGTTQLIGIVSYIDVLRAIRDDL